MFDSYLDYSVVYIVRLVTTTALATSSVEELNLIA